MNGRLRSNGERIDGGRAVGVGWRRSRQCVASIIVARVIGEHQGAIHGFFFFIIVVVVGGAEVDARAPLQGGEEGGDDAGAHVVRHHVKFPRWSNGGVLLHCCVEKRESLRKDGEMGGLEFGVFRDLG